MAKGPIQSGKTYKIIGSAKGPNGLSVGRKCIAVQQRGGVPHTLWGICWIVETADGKPFEFVREAMEGFPEVNGTCMVIDCAEDWLEEEDDEPPSAETRVKEHELTE